MSKPTTAIKIDWLVPEKKCLRMLSKGQAFAIPGNVAVYIVSGYVSYPNKPCTLEAVRISGTATSPVELLLDTEVYEMEIKAVEASLRRPS